MRPAIARPTTPPPGNNPRRPPGGRIPAGPDHARCRPPVSSRARWRRRPGQPAGPARKIRRRHDPSWPVPGRLTGNGTRCCHDPADHAGREASTPPRAGPAWIRRQPQACSETRRGTRQRRPPGPPPAGSSRTRDGSAGRSSRTRMPPPTGAWTGRDGRLLHGGCGGVPRPPGPPGEEDHRSFREPVPHAGLPEPRPQPPDPGAPLRGHGISAEAGALPPPSCDPAPDRPRHRTVRSGHPGHRPGTPDDPENDPPPEPRTASRHRHDPTPPRSLPPTARKTPNTPDHSGGTGPRRRRVAARRDSSDVGAVRSTAPLPAAARKEGSVPAARAAGTEPPERTESGHRPCDRQLYSFSKRISSSSRESCFVSGTNFL